MTSTDPRSRSSFLLCSVVALLLFAVSATRAQAPQVPQAPQASQDPSLGAAQTAYLTLDYKRAAVLLDELIAGFGSSVVPPERLPTVAAAYELRARTRLQLADADGARADFQKLLLTNPGHEPSAQLSLGTRGRTIFDEVRARTIGIVELTFSPPEAAMTVDLDGRRIPTAAATMPLTGGTHRIAAAGTGYVGIDQEFYVEAGGTMKLPLTFVRNSSTVTLLTSPPNVEVVVNGVSRGRTEIDPNAAGEGGSSISKPFQIPALPNGRYRFGFRRDCFLDVDRDYDIAQPNDYTPEFSPVRLTPAVGSLTVTASAPDAQVYMDNALRGKVPFAASDICQGAYAVDARTRFGRDVRRITLKPGQSETFNARIRPAFAVVSDSRASEKVRGGTDYLVAAEDDFRNTGSMMLFVPEPKQTAALIAQNRLPGDWLKFNLLRQPLDDAVSIGVQLRREIGASMSTALGAQGLAAVARDPAGDGEDMFLILLAPGSAVPDVIRWRPNNQASIRTAMTALDTTPSWLRSSIGLLPIDVLELDGGAVVAAVEQGGSAEAAGVRVGEVIISAGTTRVTSASQLLDILAKHPAAQPLPLELRNQAGVVRKVDVAVRALPTIVSLEDQSLLSNKLAVDYRYRAALAATPLDDVALGMNLAAVLMRLGSWSDAEAELQRVDKAVAAGKLPPSLTDAMTGTTQYLLGICAEARRDLAEAERAWKRASETRSNLLTENGAPVKELAERKLAQLRASRTDGRQ